MIKAGNIAVGHSGLILGNGGYATNAAALSAWQTIAARSNHVTYKASDTMPPAGALFWDTTLSVAKISDGSSWNTLSPGGPGGTTLDGAYNTGKTITADDGAIQINKTDATAVLRVDLDGAVASPVFDINIDAITTSPVFDLDATAAFANDVFNINLTNADAASQVLVVPDDSIAHTTAGWLISAANAGAGSANWIDLTSSGIDTGALLSLTRDTAAATGPFINLVSDATAVGSVFLDIDVVGVQTANVIEVDLTTTGSANVIEVAAASTWTGSVLSWNNTNCVGANFLEVPTTASIMTESGWVLRALNSGATSGDWIDLTATGAGTGNLIDLNANTGAFTGDFIAITTDATAVGCIVMDIDLVGAHTATVFDIDVTGISTGTIFDVAFAAASTGDVLAINMTNAVAAGAALITLAGARTDSFWQITDTSTSSQPGWNWDVGGVRTAGCMEFDINADMTANVMTFNLASQTTGNGAILIDEEGGASGGFLIQLEKDSTGASLGLDCNLSGTGSGNFIDINCTAAYTGEIFHYESSAAATGAVLDINLGTSVAAEAMVLTVTDTRTAAAFDINSDDTSALALFDIDYTGTASGNVFDFASAAAYTGDVLHINLDNTTAAQAIVLDTNATFTNPLVQIISDTGSPTASCISVATTGVGAAAVPSGLLIDSTGTLDAGADVMRLDLGGSCSATSNILSLEATAGTHTSGSYALYIDAGADSMEGIHVDAGTVLIDETLGVTGGFTTAPLYGATTLTITDPGNAGAIPVTHSGICPVSTAGAETRTLAIPTFIGQEIILTLDTDGGNAVVTVASAVLTDSGGAGDTVLTMAEVGATYVLKAVSIAGVLTWACVAYAGGTAAAGAASVADWS